MNAATADTLQTMEPTIAAESPTTPDIVALLERHLAFSRAASPPEHVHALDLESLLADDVTFCSARIDGRLLGVGAIRWLGSRRAELKSMHTSSDSRGLGVGRAMLEHLIALARQHDTHWLGLETGTMEEFAPARRLYQSVGFVPCAPFGPYSTNPFSICMATMVLDPSDLG